MSGNESKILFIEDDKLIRDNMVMLLNTFLDTSIKSVKTADDALVEFNNDNYDLLICDISTPGKIDGLDFIKIAKDKNPNIKTIVLSAYYEELNSIKANSLKLDGKFLKPIVVKDFVSEIAKIYQS